MDWGTWPPTVNQTLAFQSEINLSKSNFDGALNISNYSTLNNFTNVSITNSSQSANAVLAPVNEILIGQVFGYWLYVIVIFFITLLVYAKTESLGATSITIVLLSALVIVPAGAGVWIIPPEVSNILYILAGLGLAGSLLSWLIER
jgi:hypothetical protein